MMYCVADNTCMGVGILSRTISRDIKALAFEGTAFTSTSLTGLWGWVDGDRVLIMLLFGFGVGMVGLLGFNFSVAHISTIVLTAVQLADPALTGFMSWIAGLEGMD